MSDNYNLSRYKTNITRSSHEAEPPNLIYSPNFDTGAARIPPRPPLPPPRNSTTSYSYSNPYNYNNYNGYAPSYGRPLYGGYNSYSSYSPYNNYYNSFSGPQMQYNSGFTEEAQEDSREAFASIERIVHTFGSVNMMIESTYYALQSSFNAVLSVVDNFSRLKNQFGQILSAFTLIRSIQWLLRKLLFLLGLKSSETNSEAAWKEAANTSIENFSGDYSRKTAWPMLLFIASIYMGPFMMWKFFNLVKGKQKLSEKDAKEGNGYYAVAKYSYKAQSPEELSFNVGDYLKLAPFEKQTDKLWPLASNGKRSGVVPVNYIDIKLNSLSSNQEKNGSKDRVSDNIKINADKYTNESSSFQTPTNFSQFSTAPVNNTENLDPIKELESLSSFATKDIITEERVQDKEEKCLN